MRYCPNCGKGFESKIKIKRFCSKSCRTRFKGREQYYKHYEKYRKYKQEGFKKWYQKNKKKQLKNVLKNYHQNKEKWRERGFVFRYRKEILKILPNKCARCGKTKVKEIHHITYNLKERKKNQSKEKIQKYLKEYCKSLIPFCSRFCHRRFEREKSLQLKPWILPNNQKE